MHLMADSTGAHAPGPPLMSMQQVSHTYPDGTIALDHIDLDIHPGDRLALVGQNGSGKSTLIRHLNGLLTPSQGTISVQGQPLSTTDLRQLQRRVGILFQDPDDQLFCNTLYDDVAFGPMNQGRSAQEVDHLVRSHLTAVGLEDLMFKPAHLLSYGQKKRAAFAAVLAMEPSILILDEPTANLDPQHEAIFKRLLQAYDGTLLIIDHDLLFLWDLCQRAVVLAQGRIHHDYSLRELVSHQPSLREHGLDFTFRFTCCGHHHRLANGHRHHAHTHQHSHGHHHPVPRPEDSPLLELQHASFSYPDRTTGIDDVNLVIHPQDTLALVGQNGAGKSTLAGCLLGINQATGYLLYRDHPLDRKGRHRLWQKVGMVFQNAADQLFCPSCWEEVAFGPQQMGLPGDEVARRVSDALAQVRLTGYEHRVPLNMSGGERKRLAIAAALAMQPEFLILDEPTASLDPCGEEVLLGILEQLGIGSLLITHDLFFISRLTSRTVVLHQGRIVRDYSTTDFLADDRLQQVNGLDYTYKNGCAQEILDLQANRS